VADSFLELFGLVVGFEPLVEVVAVLAVAALDRLLFVLTMPHQKMVEMVVAILKQLLLLRLFYKK
jgi:hypothetical protein